MNRGELRAAPRADELLPERHLAQDAPGVGHGELDRVLADAGRDQRFFSARSRTAFRASAITASNFTGTPPFALL